MTRISIIAAIGLRGQLAFDGVIPWDAPDDRKHFADRTHGSVMIAGERTYKQVINIFTPEVLKKTERELLCWSPKVGDPMIFMGRIRELFKDRYIWVIGGAYTYEAFYPCINHEIDVGIVGWDSDPAFDAQVTFFPIDLYGLRDRIKP